MTDIDVSRSPATPPDAQAGHASRRGLSLLMRGFALLFGLALFVWVITRLDWKEVRLLFLYAEWRWILVGLLLVPIELWFRARKLVWLTSRHVPLSLPDAFVVYLVGLPYGFISPGRIGDLARVFVLRKRTGLRMTYCLAIALLDRLVELFGLVVVASCGLAVVFNLKFFAVWERQRYLILVLVFIAFILVAIGMILRRGVPAALLTLLRRIFPGQENLWSKSQHLLDLFYLGIETVLHDRSVLISSLVLTSATLTIISVRTWLFAMALGVHAPLIFFLIFIPTSMFVELMPISLMGLGTREFTFVYLFAIMGVSPEAAVSVSLIGFLVSIGVVLAGYALTVRENLATEELGHVLKNESERGAA